MKDSVISVERGGGLRKRCKLSPLAAIGLTMAMFGQVLVRELEAFLNASFNLLGVFGR